MKPQSYRFLPILLIILAGFGLSACTTDPASLLIPTPSQAAAQSEPPVSTSTETAELPAQAVELSGSINPLTGQPPSDPVLLQRRPILIKVQNLPRPRLQWGVSLADIVYEYYTEQGTTRFAALFYGNNAEKVGPIRSARWVDIHLMNMYEPAFVFGSAYKDLLDVLLGSDFSPLMLLEQPDSCPAICRYDPNEQNFLMADTVSLNDYINRIGIENTPPDLSGLTFAPQPPEGGKEAGRVYTRFSAAIFNRWDYDAASGRYLRFSDSQDDPEWENEIYEPLMDQLNGQQIGAENIVILLADYIELAKTEESEVYDIDLLGGGMAYGIRDGQLFNLTWSRQAEDERITFFTEDGQPYPLKPGQTWFEIMGYTSTVDLAPDGWRFTFFIP